MDYRASTQIYHRLLSSELPSLNSPFSRAEDIIWSLERGEREVGEN